MSQHREREMRDLRAAAERALADERFDEASELFEQLLKKEHDPEQRLYLHRQLAELFIDRHPWKAALHLRQVLRSEPDDDMALALMGLSQALLGNYEAAISAYLRAAALDPDVPWYLHNIGHLLDVALNRPEEARRHLELASELEPDHPEIAASLAHCLARLGEIERAREEAIKATLGDPEELNHLRLLEWIESGASEGELRLARRNGQGSARSGQGESARDARSSSTRDREDASPTARRDVSYAGKDEADIAPPRQSGSWPPVDAVRGVFVAKMKGAGFSEAELLSAHRIWDDFTSRRRVRVQKPATLAAAVEYAVALIHVRRGATQAVIAARYGISPTSLSQRYCELRDALELTPRDPRYRLTH